MSENNLFDLFTGEDEKITKASKISGIVVGIVSSNNDEENLGRIKVTFPWHSDVNESDWIRVSNPMAGNGRGNLFIPEVGEEVICGFIHGDINRPICLGSLYGIENKPPIETNDGKNNIKRIKTRSGHTITLNDKSSNESISIQSKSGHSVTFDDAVGREKIIVKDKNGQNTIEIDSLANSISINSALNLDLKATNINIHATGIMNIKANAMLKIEGIPIMLN